MRVQTQVDDGWSQAADTGKGQATGSQGCHFEVLAFFGSPTP
jgi:hypothetical protein